MKDLEVCKKIAEIEGLDWLEIKGDIFVVSGVSCHTIYDPLTDDALCFGLIIKYKLNVNVDRDNTGFNFYMYKVDDSVSKNKKVLGFSKSLNKAVCLSIIEERWP